MSEQILTEISFKKITVCDFINLTFHEAYQRLSTKELTFFPALVNVICHKSQCLTQKATVLLIY